MDSLDSMDTLDTTDTLDTRGEAMEYEPPDKPFSELTDEERDELIAHLKESYSEERWERFVDFYSMFFDMIQDVRDWWNSEEMLLTRKHARELTETVRAIVPIIQDEIDHDPELAGKKISEIMEGDRWERLVERAFERLESEGETQVTALQNVNIPGEIVSLTDKVSGLLFNGKMEPGKTYKPKSGKTKGRNPVTIAPQVSVSLLDLPPGVVVSRDFTLWDNAVFNALCSLYDNGTYQFTGATIWKTMKGDPNAQPTDSTLADIDESWTRLTSTAMQLDTGNMGDGYGFVNWVRNRRIVEGGSDTVTFRNQHGLFKVTLYTMNEEPTLKAYAGMLDQIDRYPIAVLDTPVNKTPEIIVLQNELIKHIEAIPALSNSILYETLFEKISLDAPTPGALRKKKSTLRKQIHKMLDHWKAIGFIKDWKEGKKGCAITSIIIDKGRKTLPKGAKHPEKVVTLP